MRFTLTAAVCAFALIGSIPAPARAAGCLKGAVVGGVAGHFAGHHGLIGAGAGCIIGHHEATKHAREQQQQQKSQAQPNSNTGH
jgi:hypothetical protein